MRPNREVATNNGQTYFVTSNTIQRKCFFRSTEWADLFVETLYEYRPERFAIHGFVVREDHFHLLITPTETLERAVQCVKGGFSFRARKYLGWTGDIWQAGFSDHRIRDDEDYAVHQRYIAKNALESRGIESAAEHPYCSVGGRFELDAFPPGLKPGVVGVRDGADKSAPFQNERAARFQNDKSAPFQSERTTPFQNERPAPFQVGGDAINPRPFKTVQDWKVSRNAT